MRIKPSDLMPLKAADIKIGMHVVLVVNGKITQTQLNLIDENEWAKYKHRDTLKEVNKQVWQDYLTFARLGYIYKLIQN